MSAVPKPRQYELHPLCTFFPRLAGAEFDALRDDIAAHGLREPIVLHDGMVLDGGNRYAACLAAGVEPRFRRFDGDDVVAFVLSANLHRRHLKEGQQAAIVSAATNWASTRARGGDGSNQHARKVQTGNVAGLQTVADRAAMSGASERTQRMADKVAREAPDLAAQVGRGEVSLPKAVEQIAPKKKRVDAPPVDDRVAELQERVAELSANLSEATADNESMAKVFDADDKLAQALSESKQLRAEVSTLRLRVNSLLNEKNEAVRAAKNWQRKYEALAKETGRA